MKSAGGGGSGKSSGSQSIRSAVNVEADERWRDAIRKEREYQKSWDSTWGYLASSKNENSPNRKLKSTESKAVTDVENIAPARTVDVITNCTEETIEDLSESETYYGSEKEKLSYSHAKPMHRHGITIHGVSSKSFFPTKSSSDSVNQLKSMMRTAIDLPIPPHRTDPYNREKYGNLQNKVESMSLDTVLLPMKTAKLVQQTWGPSSFSMTVTGAGKLDMTYTASKNLPDAPLLGAVHGKLYPDGDVPDPLGPDAPVRKHANFTSGRWYAAASNVRNVGTLHGSQPSTATGYRTTSRSAAENMLQSSRRMSNGMPLTWEGTARDVQLQRSTLFDGGDLQEQTGGLGGIGGGRMTPTTGFGGSSHAPTRKESSEWEVAEKEYMEDRKRGPQQKFYVPATTNMQYGWGKSLEKFGIAQHAVKNLITNVDRCEGREE